MVLAACYTNLLHADPVDGSCFADFYVAGPVVPAAVVTAAEASPVELNRAPARTDLVPDCHFVTAESVLELQMSRKTEGLLMDLWRQ